MAIICELLFFDDGGVRQKMMSQPSRWHCHQLDSDVTVISHGQHIDVMSYLAGRARNLCSTALTSQAPQPAAVSMPSSQQAVYNPLVIIRCY